MTPRDQLKKILTRHCASLAGELTTAREKFAEASLSSGRYGDLMQEVIEIVHRINGSSGSLGFRSLSSAASKFEDALNESIVSDVRPGEAEIRSLCGLLAEMQNIAERTRPQDSGLYGLDLAQIGQAAHN
jgi:HPt (histidine-containing phosphotransfer) domain-containing protein